jgi:hypothetical protein
MRIMVPATIVIGRLAASAPRRAERWRTAWAIAVGGAALGGTRRRLPRGGSHTYGGRCGRLTYRRSDTTVWVQARGDSNFASGPGCGWSSLNVPVTARRLAGGPRPRPAHADHLNRAPVAVGAWPSRSVTPCRWKPYGDITAAHPRAAPRPAPHGHPIAPPTISSSPGRAHCSRS